jgi:hypothetical protein
MRSIQCNLVIELRVGFNRTGRTFFHPYMSCYGHGDATYRLPSYGSLHCVTTCRTAVPQYVETDPTSDEDYRRTACPIVFLPVPTWDERSTYHDHCTSHLAPKAYTPTMPNHGTMPPPYRNTQAFPLVRFNAEVKHSNLRPPCTAARFHLPNQNA